MRRLSILAVGAVIALALTACASGPTDADRAGWSDWFAEVSDAASGSTVGAQLTDTGRTGDVRIDFSEPTSFGSVELRCIGSDRAAFTLTYTGADETVSVTQDIVCHEGQSLTPIAVPLSVGPLASFAASATSSDAEGYWVAILQP